MLERSETNKFITYFGHLVLGVSMIAMFIVMFFSGFEGRLLIGPAIFIAGTFNALLLYAISEILSRLQSIEQNTARANYESKKASS